MLENIRRLHPRGAASRGISVDAEGAMLGPECVLVRRDAHGFRVLDRDVIRRVQECVLADEIDRDRLFRQCQRVAEALNRGELTLAQRSRSKGFRALRDPFGQSGKWGVFAKVAAS